MAKKETPKKVAVPQDLTLAKAFAAVAETDAGRVVLAHLAVRCGFFDGGLLRLTTGEVAPLATEAKAAQRVIWAELRQLLPVAQRHAIEEFAETPIAAKSEEERKK